MFKNMIYILKKALNYNERNKSMMNENNKKLKKAEEQTDEFVRSRSVALTKKAHGDIEVVEAQRKKPAALSLISRIDIHLDSIYKFIDATINQFIQIFPDFPSSAEIANPFIKTYKSIREDFKNSMNLKDEDMEKLFSERETYFKNHRQLAKVLFDIWEQEKQMKAYLSRVIARADLWRLSLSSPPVS